MLRIFLGDAGSGISEKLCREMILDSETHPEGSYIAIVPEQATQQMQRQAVSLHPFHVVLNINITSFERLARTVFAELGENAGNVLDETGKVLILRHVLEKCRDRLDVYSKKVRMPGFAQAIKSMLSELAQYDIDDNDLFLMQERAIEAENVLLNRKLQDIRLIRKSFHDALSEKYSTSEEVLKAFARLAEKSQIIRGARIYMDGFTGFTQIQYRLIEELMKYAGDINIALTLPAGYEKLQKKPADMFYLSSKTYHRLLEIAQRTNTQVHIVRTDDAEKNNGVRNNRKTILYQAADPVDEVQFIAGRILYSVQKEGRRFRDHALICSDMESYHNLFRDIFAKAGIPCFIDYKSELADNALARYIVSAMELVVDRFSYESVFAFLKNCMSGLSGNEICRLENYCLEFGISGFSAWKKDFDKNRKKKASEDDFWDLDEMNSLRKKVLFTLREFWHECSGTPGETDKYCKALRKLLEKNGIKEKTDQLAGQYKENGDLSGEKEYEQIYEKICTMLDQISELMGRETVSQADFSELLKGSLKDLKISIIPPSLDQVVIGDLTRTRLADIRILFMSGLNDGRIPSDSRMHSLLTDRERQLFTGSDLELAPDSLENLYNQYFYIYLMMSKPSDKLYLTYAGMDMQGEELRPSCILEDLQEFGEDMPEYADTENDEMLWRHSAAQKLADKVRQYVHDFKEDPSCAGLDMEGKKLLQYYLLNDRNTLQQILSGAFFENRALPIDAQTVLDLYGERLKGSISRYEKFFECPFRHFLDYGLNIEKRPEYEVRWTDIGTIYHDGLEQYARELAQQGFSFRDVPDEKSHEIAAKCISDAAARAGTDAITSTKRSEYMLERMTSVMLRTTDVLRLHVKQGLYEPSEFEMAFYDTDHQSADFKGKIDRVDIYDGEDVYVKIIDYKSGNKKFSIRDIYTGQSLQLVAYLNEAMKEAGKKHPDRNVKAGGVYYYLVQDRFVRDEKEAWDKFRMSGLTNCDPAALKAIDTELGAGASSRVVEVSFSRNGFAGRSKVANDTEFANLMEYVDNKIEEAGSRIKNGDVSIHPAYENPAVNACIYCDYRDICKFEPGKWGCDHNALPEETEIADMEKEIYGRNSVDKGTD